MSEDWVDQRMQKSVAIYKICADKTFMTQTAVAIHMFALLILTNNYRVQFIQMTLNHTTDQEITHVKR